MTPLPPPKVLVLGMMSRHPVAGVVWQTLHYLVGLERLGYAVYYVELGMYPSSLVVEDEEEDRAPQAAAFIARHLKQFDLGDRWAFHNWQLGERCYGLTETRLRQLCGEVSAIINLHGATWPLPEYLKKDRLIFLETDPVMLQIELFHNKQETIDYLSAHSVFFTFGENYGAPDCKLPVTDRFDFQPTRQPVVVDFWKDATQQPGDDFTTIGNWKQHWRDVHFKGEVYRWSKHFEFIKFLDLPQRTGQGFELAMSGWEEADRQRLRQRGWKLRNSLDFSLDIDAYRSYIQQSRGEFTVAKDQNVRLRSGWFSDRSATYLAAGRPVITQETGFSNIFPTGMGLFGFSTMEEILEAVEAVNAAYASHARAAAEIARAYFNYDVVLPRLLEGVGLSNHKATVH